MEQTPLDQHNIKTKQDFLDHMTALLNEYADEAEHQEGEEYWTTYFARDRMVELDFARYVFARYDVDIVTMKQHEREGE